MHPLLERPWEAPPRPPVMEPPGFGPETPSWRTRPLALALTAVFVAALAFLPSAIRVGGIKGAYLILGILGLGVLIALVIGLAAFLVSGRSRRAEWAVVGIVMAFNAAAAALFSEPGLRLATPWLSRMGVDLSAAVRSINEAVESGRRIAAGSPERPKVRVYRRTTASVPPSSEP